MRISVMFGMGLLLAISETLGAAGLPEVPGGKIVELPCPGAGMAVYTALPTRKVFIGEELAKVDLDRQSRRIYLAGAPGETEQILLVFRSAVPQTGMKPEFAGLQAGEESIDPENFRLAQVGNVTMPGISNWYGFNGYETGAVPDPVDWKNSFDWAAGVNNVLLLEVRIPRTASPGNYHGELLFSNGANRLTLPMEVAVWPFTLPEKNTLSTMVCGVSLAEPGPFARFQNIVTHVKYGSGRYAIRLNDDRSAAEFEDRGYLADLKTMREKYKIEQFALPPSLLGGSRAVSPNYLSSGIAVDSEKFSPLHRSFLQAMNKTLKQADLNKAAFYYPMDEFPAASAGAFARIAADAKAVAPDLPVMALTDRWWPELAASPNIDIWCVPWHFFVTKDSDPAEWAKLHQAGLQLWSYMNSLYCINATWNPRAMRFFPIVMARYNYTGALWWHVTYFEGKNVRQTPAGLMNKSKKKYMYGSGYLFYQPETAGGEWGSSLRWENYVQGVEDYNLMQLLKERWQAAQKALGNADEAFNADAALAMFASRLSSTFRAQNYYGDALYMNRFRQLLAQEIATLPESPQALVVFEPIDTRDADTLHLRGIIAPGTQVTVNGQKPEMWNHDQAFSIEMPLHSGANCFEIVVVQNGRTKRIYREVIRR